MEKPGRPWLPPCRSTRTRIIDSVVAPVGRSTAIVVSASLYSFVTRKVSPVSSFLHTCPTWMRWAVMIHVGRLYASLEVFRVEVEPAPGPSTIEISENPGGCQSLDGRGFPRRSKKPFSNTSHLNRMWGCHVRAGV